MTVLIEARRRNDRTCWEFCECHAADRRDLQALTAAGKRRKPSR